MKPVKSVEETIKDIIIGILHYNDKPLTPETTWKDLEADSLDLVQMLVALEETYGIEISDEDAESLANFGDVVRYMEKRIVAKV